MSTEPTVGKFFEFDFSSAEMGCVAGAGAGAGTGAGAGAGEGAGAAPSNCASCRRRKIRSEQRQQMHK